MRMVNKFGEGRVFVVGGMFDIILRCLDAALIANLSDAAHVHSPTGGQVLHLSVHNKSVSSYSL